MPTGIEWATETLQPVTGCTPISEGCRNCYAAREASGRLQHHPRYAGLAVDGKWTGEVRLNESELERPLHWKKPRRIFVCSHGDLFHKDVPDDWLWRVFGTMADCPQHTFLLLTKRALRMADFVNGLFAEWGDSETSHEEGWVDKWQHICLGISAETQSWFNARWSLLRGVNWPGLKFVSCEPLLGSISLSPFIHNAFLPDWIIVGGESGPAARPMHPDLARGIRDECAAANVPFFFKQWGEWAPDEKAVYAEGVQDRGCGFYRLPSFGARICYVKDTHHFSALGPDRMFRIGKKAAGRTLDGKLHDEYPEVKA